MVYTISPDLLRNINSHEGLYFTDILFVFAQRSNILKISRDPDGEVLRIYESIKENGDIIKTWLDLMSFVPSPFEVINVDITSITCEETKFLKLCKETIGQSKIIFYSKQNIRNYIFTGPIILFEDLPIIVLDRDQARIELNALSAGSNHTIINSQVALDGSQIIESSNN